MKTKEERKQEASDKYIEAVAPAYKAYDEATDTAFKACGEAMAKINRRER